MMGRLLMGPAGPEREPGSTGEWVNLKDALHQADLTAQARALGVDVPMDPIADVVADLVRRFDPGGYRLHCPVAGCRWELDVPRMELDPTPLDVDLADRSYTVFVEGVPREDVERTLGEHLDQHATDGAPPPKQPPDWEQQEWCDGGTCEHPACLDAL